MSPILRNQTLEKLLRNLLKWGSFAGAGAGIYLASFSGKITKSMEIKDLEHVGEGEYLINDLRSTGSWTVEKRYIGLNFKINCEGTGKVEGWESKCRRIIETTKTVQSGTETHYIEVTTTKPTTKHEKGKHYRFYREDGQVIEGGHKEYYGLCGPYDTSEVDICKYPPKGWKSEEMTFP